MVSDGAVNGRLRVALCDDFREERWPSMDRVAAMLHQHLTREHRDAFEVDRVRPPFLHAATRVPLAGRTRAAFKADRFLNRFWRYPRHLEPLASEYDLFHIVDHSYAHLAHALPAGRTVVTCHDLDAFRSLLAPISEPRSSAFRAMTSDVLTGLQRVAAITCDTAAVRDELVTRGLVAGDRVVVAPLGVDDVFFQTHDAQADRTAAHRVPRPSGAIEILHVGTTAPRKRIDVLLRFCAALRFELPQVRLTRVGGAFTDDQQRLLHELRLDTAVTAIDEVDEAVLAALYRRAAIVVQPSEREGFGLPVLEALASGTPVVASDLTVLREIGGDVVDYCPVGDVETWTEAVRAQLAVREEEPARWHVRRERGRQHARRFTWQRFACEVAKVYRNLA